MQDLNKMFSSIAGYDKIKEEAAQIVDMLVNVDAYISRGAHCPRGWLFYGAPGMGKTQIVKEIAKNANCDIIEVSLSDALTRGCSIEEDIVEGFKQAKEKGKAILFLDEIDKFTGYNKFRYDKKENIDNAMLLLHELDGIKQYNEVFVMATANNVEQLPNSLLRSGRFDRQILFHKPGEKDRRALLYMFFGKVTLDSSIDVEELVKMTNGRSCADIECIVNETIISAVARRDEIVRFKDFTQALNRVVFKDIPKDTESITPKIKDVAYHEAGHALMGYILQPDKLDSASITSQGGTLGSVRMNGDDVGLASKSEMEQRIMISLAGMCAEELMAGEMSTGNCSDIKRSVGLAKTMLDEGFYGMGYVAISAGNSPWESETCNEQFAIQMVKIKEILDSMKKRVETILAINRDILESIATALVDKGELRKSEIIELARDYQKVA